MDSFWQVFLLVAAGISLIVAYTVLCMCIGGWLVFKASRAVPGEKFLGGVPKGEVFLLPDALDAAEFPEQSEEEKSILEKAERFLKKLGG